MENSQIGKTFCLINYLDNDLKYLQFYILADRENFESFLIDLHQLKIAGLQVDSITSDGKKSLIKAVKQIFTETVHQRCLIHIQRMSLLYLGGAESPLSRGVRGV